MSRRPPPRRSLLSAPVGFAVLIAVAVVVNLAQFQGIDEDTNRRWQAINRSDTPDVLVLGYKQSPNFRERYGLSLALAELAPGSTVLVPDEIYGEEFAVRLYSLGLADRVERISDVPDWEGLDPAPRVVARGDGGSRAGPWAIATIDADVDTDDTHRFVRRAFRNGYRGGETGPPREFVAVPWEAVPAEAEFDFEYRLLLLETALLPATGTEPRP